MCLIFKILVCIVCVNDGILLIFKVIIKFGIFVLNDVIIVIVNNNDGIVNIIFKICIIKLLI